MAGELQKGSWIMKIILATGIFPPEIGGPAAIVENLSKSLINNGEKIEVITYTSNLKIKEDLGYNFKVYHIKRTSVFLNYLKYFLKLNSIIKKGDIIIAFDALSAGLPCALINLIKGNKLIVRLGGDFLWEQSVNSGLTNLPLTQFYKKDSSYKKKIRFKIIKWVLRQAKKIVLTNEWYFNIIKEPYNLLAEKTVFIKNSFPKVNQEVSGQSNVVIAAGRFIKLKNFENLIKVFSEINNPNAMLIIYGSGPLKNKLESLANKVTNIEIRDSVNQADFLLELKKSRFYIQSSLSEVSPNTVLQAISLGIPVLMSKNCGYYDWLKDKIETFDPYDNQELKAKIGQLYDEGYYQKVKERQSLINTNYHFKDMAIKYLDLIRNL